MPEREPDARSGGKRPQANSSPSPRDGIALGEIGFRGVPILKGDTGRTMRPTDVVGSLTPCAGYRGLRWRREGLCASGVWTRTDTTCFLLPGRCA